MLNALGVVRVSGLAGIQYLGTGADSRACVHALRRVIAWPERPSSVLLLTSEQAHAFLLTFEREIPVAIKDGFSSGYIGAGPSALADALELLQAANIEVEEVLVSGDVLARLSASALTHTDLREIESAKPVRPVQWYDYVYAIYKDRRGDTSVWAQFEPVMPFALVDQRLADLALDFLSEHDRVLLDGFRRLEDLVRKRTGLDEYGTKLFSLAFAGEESRLVWKRSAQGRDPQPGPIEKGEQAGRAQLFTGAYQAFRNPRAHRTPNTTTAEALAEFLLLNQLFRLEAEAVDRPSQAEHEQP